MSAADYSILGLKRGASAEEARAAFRKLALRYHPDKNRGNSAAADMYLAVQQAYEAVVKATARGTEADELLCDPLADLFGPGWARGFADGSLNPEATLASARQKAERELGGDGGDLAAVAAEYGLEGFDEAELATMLESKMGGLGGAGGLDGLEQAMADRLEMGGLGGLDAAALAGLSGIDAAAGAEGGEGGANVFKAFFDEMPEEQRGPMMALFEKTFPAFLANEMQEQQLQVENALFAQAVAKETLPNGGGARPAVSAEVEEAAAACNAEGVAAFGEGRYGAAADAISRAIALDPANPVFYGNRSLAREKAGRHEEALDDAESCLRADATYVAGYERKGRALLGLKLYAEAQAAAERGRILDPDHVGLGELALEAGRAAVEAKINLVRVGRDVIDDEKGGRGSDGPTARIC